MDIEKKREAKRISFCFYTDKARAGEELEIYQGEREALVLSKERMRTAVSLSLWLEGKPGGVEVNGKFLAWDGYLFLTVGEEELLVIAFTKRMDRLAGAGLSLTGREEVTIGTDYHNPVFYSCFSFVCPKHISLHREERGYRLEIAKAGNQGGRLPVYLNGEPVQRGCLLKPGDRIELFGLVILYLGSILVCTAFFGSLRLSEGKGELPVCSPEKKKAAVHGTGEGERRTEPFAETASLHQGEWEIALPEPWREPARQPLFFSLGPSVTMVLPMLLMALAGSRAAGQSGMGFYGISLVMTISSAFLSLFWGLTRFWYDKKISDQEKARRREIYRDYLKKVEEKLEACRRENRRILKERYPDFKTLLQTGEGESPVFWNRRNWEEAWFVRMGLGSVPFQIRLKLPEQKRELNQDILMQEAFALADKFQTLSKAPVGISLSGERLIGAAGEGIWPVVLQMLLQAAAHYPGREMKLVYFFHEKHRKEQETADCLKWLPHVFSKDRKVRFLAGNEREAGEILPVLGKEIQAGDEKEEKAPVFYLFVIGNEELIRGEGLYQFLTKRNRKKTVSALFVQESREALPGGCSCLVLSEGEREELYTYEKGAFLRQKAVWEKCPFSQAESYMRRLAALEGRASGKEEGLLEKVSFLSLFSCRNVKELHCRMRWSENRLCRRLKTPIGKTLAGRLISLDIHEKFHGPHGIVAGTTGAGKSELLQTYLLSLTVHYSPEEVTFFIIDYKGGGMGNGLKELPHCAGVISNLSGRTIRRALASVKSEVLKRQRLLSQAGAGHMEEYGRLYQKKEVSVPMPHLILVVDEFAELKKEEPEFMQEMISISQVGRSLGLHLLLATQKPAGTVDDKIFSNTRFRLCLRVAERQDSMDMLKRPEGAELTGAGSCYLQVGNNEIFDLFQAGYGGEVYDPERKEGEAAVLVERTGRRIYEPRQEKKGISEMQAVIAYIKEVMQETDYQKAASLCKPELPEILSLSMLKEQPEEAEEICICLGLYDDPENQSQAPLFYNPKRQGHICLCGSPGSGKSTCLQTLLWQLVKRNLPSRVRYLLYTGGCGAVRGFEQFPHCLGRIENEEGADCFFFQLEELIKARKQTLSGISFERFQAGEEQELPAVFLIIDGYGSFRRLTEDRYLQQLEELAGEGQGLGIFLVITALSTGRGEMTASLLEKIKVTLCLEMSDRYQYGDILRQYAVPILPKEGVKGRGLCRIENRVLEWQAPLFIHEKDDYERIKAIERERQERFGEKPVWEDRFREIPRQPVYSRLWQDFRRESRGGPETEPSEERIPLGYDLKRGRLCEFSPVKDSPFLIGGEEGSGKRTLLYSMIQSFLSIGKGVAVLDRKGAFSNKALRKKVRLLQEETSFFDWLKQKNKELLCICDLADLAQMLSESGKRKEEKEWEERLRGRGGESAAVCVAVLQTGKEQALLGSFLYEVFREAQRGVHLGGNAGEQRLLAFQDLPYGELGRQERPGYGYLKTGPGSGTVRVRLPAWEGS